MTEEYKKQIELDAEKKYPPFRENKWGIRSEGSDAKREGYIAGRTEEAEKIKPLVEALEECLKISETRSNKDSREIYFIAKEALKKYNNDDLLAPRYLVIADYPGNHFNVGNILYHSEEHEDRFWYSLKSDGSKIFIYNVDLYPHLFRLLHWWEFREEKDMPEYVKIVKDECSIILGSIIKPKSWGIFPDEGRNWGNENQPYAVLIIEESTKTHDKGEEINMHCNNLRPATEAEYNEYKNSLK